MLNRALTAVLSSVGAALIGAPAIALAQPPAPPPPPPAPNVNAYPPANPKDYAVLEGTAYAFSSNGLTCMLQRSGGYGCNGMLPGAPQGANLVSGVSGGVPGWASAPAPIFGGPVNALPPNTRLSFGTVSCGGDGALTACVDSRNQSGFVVSPGGSWIVNEVNPLLARPEGTNPYFN